MYKVYIADFLYAEFEDDVQAVQLALAVHQSGTTPHHIWIEKDDETIVTLQK